MTEPVSPPYKLPPEVLARLGDDATPERAVASFTAHRDESHPCADMDADEALGMYQHALAAAAIRECEARRAWAEASEARADGPTLQARHEAHDAAWAAYDALRNWRNRR